MWTYLTEQAAEILLDKEEVQTLVKGEVVIGAPLTTFMSPFGERIVIVRQGTPEEIRKEIRARREGRTSVRRQNDRR